MKYKKTGNHFPNLPIMKSLALISFLFVLFFSSCGKMEEPVFNNIGNIRVAKMGISTSLMTFDMQYFNPNKSAGKLKEAEGEAWLDSNYVGHFHVDTLVMIPAKANFTVPVKMDVDMKYFLKYSLSGFKNEDVLITVKGKAKVGKGGFYKNIPLDYEARRNLNDLFNSPQQKNY